MDGGIPDAREPIGSAKCAGNGGWPLDPQRQYARLLTLWAVSAKASRRMEYLARGRWPAAWHDWWRLGRRLSERGLAVLPVPGVRPVLFVGFDGPGQSTGWLALTPPDDEAAGKIFGAAVGVDMHSGAPALVIDQGRWVVSVHLALRMGQKLWRVFLAPPPLESAKWTNLDDALTLLGAMVIRAGVFERAPLEDWMPLARLWRHRGVAQQLGPWPGSTRYAWIRRLADGRYLWPGQDEDSVHSACRSPGGRASGGRRTDV